MSKYDPLAEFLREQRGDTCTLTFPQIELILGDQLPNSAREYDTWWATARTQGRAWHSAGWRVSNYGTNVRLGVIVFVRHPLQD